MNEQIRELMVQADYPAPELALRAQKLAELIVRECIDWCNAHARDDGTAQRIAEDIKKDFGVEE